VCAFIKRDSDKTGENKKSIDEGEETFLLHEQKPAQTFETRSRNE
jgi:hypothetical protein